VRIFRRDEGQGEPVVLVHGLGASHHAFDELISLGGARYLAVDLPGVGTSEAWAQSAPREIASALSAHLTGLGISRYRLFGHSFGGLIALSMAAQQPSSVVRLVVANAPGLGLSADTKAFLQHPMFARTASWLGGASLPMPKPLVRAYLAWLWGDARPVTERAVEQSIENAKSPRFMPSMFDSLRAIADYQLPVAALREAPFEKHVLWGERDRLVSAIEGERLAIAIGAKLRVLPRVGHCLPEEAPHEVRQALGLE